MPSRSRLPPPQTEVGVNKGPQVAINGFIAWLVSLLISSLYVLWAILPDEVLHRMHITYYPDKYWAVAAPAILVMFFFYYFTSYICVALAVTYPLDDGRCVTDVDCRFEGQVNVRGLSESTSGVQPWMDIPVSVASQVLFQPW